MPRNKFPEETINAILDVSTKLFLERGYDTITMNDIVAGLGGLTRGAIYHHFKNKEEILESVMARMFRENNVFLKIEQERNMSGKQKIKKLLILSLTSTQSQEMHAFSLSLMKNTRILARQLEEAVTELAPLIEKWIIEGYKDGSIEAAEDSKEAAETIAILVNIWANPSVFSVTRKQLISKFQYMGRLFEGLGIHIIDDEVMEACQKYADSILLM